MKRALQLAWVFLSACVLIGLIGVGDEAIEALALTYFGFRPIHWVETAFNGVWYFILVPLYLVAIGIVTWLLVRAPRRDRAGRRLERAVRGPRTTGARDESMSALSLILVGTPVVAVSGWFFFAAVAPQVRHGTQRESWPAAIALTSFDVCAIEMDADPLNRQRAFGRLAFEIANHAPRHLVEATFTVEGGADYQHTLRSLAPGAIGRVEVETDLGPLLCGGRNAPAGRCRFRLLWDRVRFEGQPSVSLEAAPPGALTSIRDCPRFDVRGAWKGTDGSTLRLDQAGTRVTGNLAGGPFSSSSGIIGQAKDGMVTGTVTSRAGPFLSEGTFSLTSRPGGALQGTWIFAKGNRAGENGAWTLTRVHSDPPEDK